MNAVSPQDTLMFAEAADSADAVARQLAANAELIRSVAERLRSERPRGAITYARGSSDSAATFAKYVLETRAGVLTTSAAPSVASLYGGTLDVRGLVAIAISQSGRSPDILAAVDAADKAGAFTLGLVNVADSPLAACCDAMIPLHAGPERSVAATKSYVASLSAILHLAAEWSEDEELLDALLASPALLRQAWQCNWSALVQCLLGARGLYVIGRGPGLAIAQEAALKLKETCRLHAEAFSAAEVRHGPMALVGPDFPLLVFRQSDESAEGVDELVRDVAAEGVPVFIAGGEVSGATTLPIPSAHELIEPMLQIEALYRAASELSVGRGLDPDRPPHLKKVTETL
jgi:glutamine---fructose-6-phosphate transaminase (isomerizing)